MAEKSSENRDFNITIPIYEGVDLMDVAAPYEMFNWMGFYWKPERDVNVKLAAAKTKSVITRDGFKITPDISFADFQKNDLQTHLLWVPGGDLVKNKKILTDKTYLNFIKKQSEKDLINNEQHIYDCFSNTTAFLGLDRVEVSIKGK